jgi:hypothetical protein
MKKKSELDHGRTDHAERVRGAVQDYMTRRSETPSRSRKRSNRKIKELEPISQGVFVSQ